jgi:hypothetical protein
MEYPLPQFLSIKAKVAGPLNLKQLIYVVLGVGGAIMIYFVTQSLGKLLLFGLPLVIIFLMFAFGKIKGFDIPTILGRSFGFLFAGKKYIWKKVDAPAPMIPKAKPKEVEKVEESTVTLKMSGRSKLTNINRLIEIHPK